MSFEFEDAAVPLSTGEPNPFVDTVKALPVDPPKGTVGAAKVITVPNADVKTVTRQLAEAGSVVGVTVRKLKVEGAESTRITFWAVTKIIKGKSDTAPEASAAPVKGAAKS